MFIEQRPRNSKQRVTKVVMAPHEVELLWVALANSTANSPTTERLRRLLWDRMSQDENTAA